MQGHEMVPEQSVPGECDERGLRENGPGKNFLILMPILRLYEHYIMPR